jgi:YVTN family beta-propeller protein
VVASGDAVTGEPVLVEVPGYQLSYTTPARLTFLATDVAGHEGSASVEIGLKPLIDIEAGSYGEIVVSRDGTRAFVTDHQDDAIDVIDLDRGSPTFHSVIGTHSFGGEPRDLALTPADDRLYVLFQEDSLIAVIDTASLTVIDVFQAGLAPNGIAISPAGQRAYYASFDETIRVLDVDPASPTYNQELARFAPEPLLLSARSAVSADGRRLILAWSGMIAMGTTIIDIDPSSPSYLHVVARPLPLVSGGPHGVALSADGAHAFARVSRYVEEFGLALGDIDLETGAVAARTYSGPLGQLGLVATPDGRFLVSCSGNDPQLHLIDVAKMKAIESVSLGVAASMSCAITPDGSELYIPGEHRTWALPLF